MNTVWVKRALFSIVGASLGFAYYYFIGCRSGTCPITSNPWITTVYGAGTGLLMGFIGGSPAGKPAGPAGGSTEPEGKSNGKIE